MKNLFVVFAAVAMLSGPVMALEPGPVQNLSQSAVGVARVLMNAQVQACIAKINNLPYDFSPSKITFQAIKPGASVYTISGVAIEGGDIAVGSLALKVTVTRDRGIADIPVTVYKCEVSELPSK